MPQLPSRDGLERLLAWLRSRRGETPVVLQAGDEEVPLGSCLLTPREAPEVALLLEEAEVQVCYRAPV